MDKYEKVSDKLEFSGNKIWYITIILLSLISLLAFYKFFEGNMIIYYSKYLLIILLFSILVYLLRKQINYLKLIIFSTVLIVVCSLGLFQTLNYSVSTAIQNIIMYCFVGIMSVFLFSKINLARFKSLIYVFLIITFFFTTLPSLLNMNNQLLYSNFDNRLRYLGVFSNPNELGRFSLLGILISIRVWYFSKKLLNKTFLFFMIVSNFYLIYLSDSRASMLVAILAILMLILIRVFKILPLNIFLSSCFFAVALVIGIIFYYFGKIGINIDLNEFTSGRFSIWLGIFDSSWLGILLGMGAIEGQGSHNGYLEMIKYFGIVGFLVWLIIIFYLLVIKAKIAYKEKTTTQIMGFFIVILFMIYHLFEGGLVSMANLASIYLWLEISQRDGETSK